MAARILWCVRVITYRFTTEDLLRIRFAISPLFDLTWSTNTLRDPARRSLHLPWVRAVRQRLDGLDWRLLEAVASDTGDYVPDFISPPPSTPLADLEGELERVRATPPERVAQELAWRFRREPAPEDVAPLLADPERLLDVLVAQMAAYWERAVEPWWASIRGVLEADIHDRARRLTAGGALSVFSDLHPAVRWRDGAIEVERRHEQDVELRGRGLLLVPAAFAWPDVFSLIDEPWQPALVYTPRGVGDLWAPAEDCDPDALAALLGGRRAEILVALRAPAATSDLAARLGASAGGVSEHLGVLRRAGLVTAERDGRRVLYRRTAAGEALLRAPAE
jgi:DNA-binding transcriptional ArsR family regulator